MKKILLLFALMMPLMASAYDALIDGIYYNLNSSDNTAEVTNGESINDSYSGSVTIPANITLNGVNYSVNKIGNSAFFYCMGLTSVTIPNSVTCIGEDAFSGCSALKSITIPNSVTEIKWGAFSDCSALTFISLPNSVTEIGNSIFWGCSNLKIELNCNAIVSKSYSFGFSLKDIFGEQIKEYVIGDEVTSIGDGAFMGCSGLTSITIGNNVKSIKDYAFYGCSSLTSITIGNSLTSIGRQVFYECSNLTSISVSSENAKYDSRDNSNAIIETSANKLILGSGNTIIPQNVTTIGNGAFEDCSVLTSITIPNSVKVIEDFAFSGCSGLTSITIPNSIASIYYGVFQNCTGLTSVTIPDNVISIDDYAFYGCSSLTSIELPSSITHIGNCTFKDCSGLTDVYCFAENIPTTSANAFEIDLTNATLYVPRVSAEAYKTTTPWSEFGNYVSLSDGEVEINETNFPDENFRNYLLSQSYGEDGVLTNAEIDNINSISVEKYYSTPESYKIKSLKGIEYFTELNTLRCYYNKLTSLDLSKNTKLKDLNCDDNELTSLDVSKNTALTSLSCGYNKLTSLDISNNTALTSLSCSSNQFTSLDVSKNTALTYLFCPNNQLTSLNVSGCSVLTSLTCYGNQIKGEAMDALVEGLPTITSSSIYDGKMEVIDNYGEKNMMTIAQVEAAKAKGWKPLYNAGSGYSSDWKEYAGIDPTKTIEINETNFPDENFRSWLLTQSYGEDGMLTETEILTTTDMYIYSTSYGSSIQSLKGIEYFTELTSLSCTNNSLTSIDLSKNTKLTSLDCYSNQISGEGMDALIASLPTVNDGELNVIYNYNEGNEMSTAQAAAAKAKGWTPQIFDSSSYSWIEYAGMNVDPSLLEKFPDVAFRNYLLSQPYGMDGNITEEDMATVTSIDVPRKNIKSLKGIEYFTALEMLDCSNNQLTELDLSKNTALTFLKCYNNQLTSLDLSKNTLLTDLDCSNNQLKTLNLSGCKKLVEVGVGYNQLTTLDLSGCKDLEEFGCENNQLTSLNLSGCTALDRLDCYNNQLKGASMDALIASLPTINYGRMRILDSQELYEEGSGNTMTYEQVAAAKTKGWSSQCRQNYEWVDYVPNDADGEGIAIDETNFPDENFRNYLLDTSYGYDAKLTNSEASLVSTIDVNDLNIQNLKGIEYFIELKKLICGYNQISTLDLSKNTKLSVLECYGNGMTALNVSACMELTRLECMENQLTSLDVSNMPMLVDLYCSENQLTSLDVSKSTKLENLECFSNQLTSLDVSNNSMLESLECEDNQLTSLDVSNNPVLSRLRIHRNQIKGAAMDAFVESLRPFDINTNPDVYGIIRVIYNENEGNVMTTTQVRNAWKKGWDTRYYNGTYWDTYFGSEPESVRGDVNDDGEVNVGDLVSVSNFMAGDESVSLKDADVNEDGEVNVGDLVTISNIMAGNE